MWYIRSLLVLKILRYTEELYLFLNTCLFSLYISLNIFRSNKRVSSCAIVDIDRCVEPSVIVQVQFRLLLSEITY